MYKYLRDICKEKGIKLIQGLVKNSGDSALGFWIKQGYTKGSDLIWVEDRLDKNKCNH